MKKLRFLLPAFIVFAAACKALNQSADQPKLEETHWKLIAMDQKPVDLGDKAFIEFKADRASGKAACNSFSAEYELTNSKIAFDKIISTKMYCDGLMDQESKILANLQKVKRYEIRYGMLYLYGADNLLLTFKK